MEMEGDFTWTQGDSFLNFLQEFDKISPVPLSRLGPLKSLVEPKTTGKVSLNMTMPDHFAFGTSLQVTPRFKLNTDLKFTRWSKWQELEMRYAEPLGVLLVASFVQPDAAPAPMGQVMIMPIGLEDTWNLAFGFEYQWSDSVALRAGYEDRPSSIPKAARSPVLPIGDAKLYSIGAEYKPNPTQTFSVAVATMQSSTFMPGNTSKMGNSENPTLLIYNPYSGSDLEANLDVMLMEASYRVMW